MEFTEITDKIMIETTLLYLNQLFGHNYLLNDKTKVLVAKYLENIKADTRTYLISYIDLTNNYVAVANYLLCKNKTTNLFEKNTISFTGPVTSKEMYEMTKTANILYGKPDLQSESSERGKLE